MSRTTCPDCNASRGLAEYSDGTYCHACKKVRKHKNIVEQEKKVKKVLSMPVYNEDKMPQPAAQYLNQYYITENDIERCDVFWSEEYQRICFPYYVQYQCPDSEYILFCWARSLEKQKKDKWIFIGQKDIKMYYWKAPKKECKECTPNFDFCRCTKRLVIVEDQISAIRVSNHLDCLSLGGTNVYNPLLLKYMVEYDEIVLWLDGDEAGQGAVKKFIKRYKLSFKIKQIKTDNDPKTYNNKEIRDILSLPIDKT